jgi:hypothetical protein
MIRGDINDPQIKDALVKALAEFGERGVVLDYDASYGPWEVSMDREWLRMGLLAYNEFAELGVDFVQSEVN